MRPTKTRYFLDTEFIEAPFYLAPISIALVDDTGREFYAVDASHDVSRADPWVIANVIPKLPPRTDPRWMTRAQIATGLRAFVDTGAHPPEVWAYFGDYDWVLFAWLLGGRMIDMPEGWPHLCLDLKQAMMERGISKDRLPAMDPTVEHDALADARWGMAALRMVLGT